MISILVPSRGRPQNIERLHASLIETTHGPWEMIVRLDDDDVAYPALSSIRYITGPRRVLSAYWNECYEVAQGPVYMHGGDDIVFKTPGWDVKILEAFPEDGIALVHGNDLGDRGATFATHGFLHRKWVETVGYFVPPLFSSDFNDTWLNSIANILDRRIYVPIVTEHMHPGFGKAELDATHLERIERHKQDDPDSIYRNTAADRVRDAQKLLEVMT